MNEKKEIFADGIGQIHFAGGMIRYDFVTLQPEEEGKAPIPRSIQFDAATDRQACRCRGASEK